MTLEGFDSEFALIDVAPVIAICELSCEFSQIVLSDGLAAKMTRTVRLRSGSPAIHQEKLHLGSPNHNKNSDNAVGHPLCHCALQPRSGACRDAGHSVIVFKQE